MTLAEGMAEQAVKALLLRQQHPKERIPPGLTFERFLKEYVYLRDVLPDRTARVTQWEMWDFHAGVLADLHTCNRIIGLKARQLGFSWLLAALQVYDAIRQPAYLGGVVSAGQAEAAEFLAKCAFIAERLPREWDVELERANMELLSFRNGGAIMAFPSTAKAGRGYTFNRFIADEAAFHQFAELNFAAYEPATEYGQIIICSSAGNDEQQAVNDWFARMWQAARDGQNGFEARFYGASLRPGRDDLWKRERRARLSGRPGAYEREYPESPEEAFRSMLRLRFDVERIDAARGTCRAAMGVVLYPPAVAEKHLRVWATPRAGTPYVAYTDAAENRGRDYTVTVILEARSLRHVATLRENVLEPSQHGVTAIRLCRWYNNAYYGVERNQGAAIFYAIGQEHYEPVYWHEQAAQTYGQLTAGREPTKRLGFPVTEQTRSGLLDDLAEVIETGALSSDDDGFWGECATFVLNDRKGGRPEAAVGCHDDIVMAMAGAVRMARQPGAQTLGGQQMTEKQRAMVRGHGW